MLFPYYCVLQNGQIEAAPVGEFRLHDSFEQFERDPRVFTTFLARRGGAKDDRDALLVTGLSLHKQRLLHDAKLFALAGNSGSEIAENLPNEIMEAIQNFASVHALELPERFLVRIVLGKGKTEMYFDHFVPRWKEREAIALHSYTCERPHVACKTTATGVSREAHSHALANKADEALLIDPDRFVSEGAWSTFFWFAKGGTLFTRGDRILPGTTRQILFQEVSLDFKSIKLEDLRLEAQEAFIGLSTYGLVPVRSIDDWELPRGAPGPLTRSLLELWQGFELEYSERLFVPLE